VREREREGGGGIGVADWLFKPLLGAGGGWNYAWEKRRRIP
jgi:hypothetical protein